MNDVLKQRLVGALILVALGVVFWPLIFVEPGATGGAEGARIPPRPAVATTPVPPPDMAGLRPSREIVRATEPAALAPESGVPAAGVPAAGVPAAEAAPAAPERTAPAPEPQAVKKTRSEPPVKPALDAEGLPIAWILRVASVSSPGKADQLRKDLLDMGHKAYVKKINSGGRSLYRVYVGPKVEKARLEKIQDAVNTRFGVESMITRYYP